MAPTLLRTYQFAIDLRNFLHLCWYNHEFYEHFLVQRLKDLGVEISPWQVHAENNDVQIREIKSFHPSKISFPGLPSHAEVKFSYFLIQYFPEIVM